MAEQLFDLGATLFDLVARAVRGLPPLGADLNRLLTLTGLTLEALLILLDKELPASAYKGVPGPVRLTDVCPNQMRLVLTEAFGPCGLGWGYVYDPSTVILRDGGKGVDAVVTGFAFWYRLTDGEQVYTCMIPATGGSDNRSAAYALKGALTNALGNAVSNIGFQISVYLGQRSHETVGAKRQAAVRAVATAAKPAAKAAPKPASDGAAAAAKVELRFGKHQGKTLGEILAEDPSYLEWLADNARDADLRATVGLLLSAAPPPKLVLLMDIGESMWNDQFVENVANGEAMRLARIAVVAVATAGKWASGNLWIWKFGDAAHDHGADIYAASCMAGMENHLWFLDWLVSRVGFKGQSVVSYNSLGNNEIDTLEMGGV